ncbi:MAG: helix-turn-helix domain-containing protein [Nitratireductor sp.]|nr:helix-turn-helix domain-containing protein [Nitratireductor sp.]
MTIYISLTTPFEISVDGGPWETRPIVALPPFAKHRVRSPSGLISAICIESETVDPDDLSRLTVAINAPATSSTFHRYIQDAHHYLGSQSNADGFSTSEFDHLFLGEELKSRGMDERIVAVLNDLSAASEELSSTADTCAAKVSLSASRFLHLFKDNTSVPFRSYRMWRRARRFMDRVDGQDSLTDVALDLGYPDSSHFSHSIRQIFGLQPRSIRAGSQDLLIHTGSGYKRMAAAFA